MNISLSVTAIVLICLFGGALVGTAANALVPDRYLSTETMDVIKLVTGLMATIVALVLSLLINTANTSRTATLAIYRESLVNAKLLDHYLVAYGPETQPALDVLRHIYIRRFQLVWPQEDFGPPEPDSAGDETALMKFERLVLQLSPRSEAQKWYREQVLQATNNLGKTYAINIGGTTPSMLPFPLLTALISWSTVMFMGFGVLAPPRAGVILPLLIGALSASAAILVILELDNPVSGLFQVPSDAAHMLLTTLNT